MNNQDSNMAANAICRAADMAGYSIETTASDHRRHCVVFRAELSKEENMWSARFGDLVGFGTSPAKALTDFDKNFVQDIQEPDTKGESP